jgi:chromosome segregation ATPase
MPELTEVETPKNAGFVQNKSNQSANKKRIEKDEAELKSLMEGNTKESNEEETAKAEEANTEAEEATLSPEERTYKKRYSDLRKHLNKQTEEIKELKAQMENASSEDLRPPKSKEEIEAWSKKNPEAAAILKSFAKAEAEKTDKEVQELKELNKQTQRIKSENAIRKMHPEFD